MSYSNLFVAKLPRNLNDADLEQIFAEYFPISAKVMLDAATGKSKGFGFVLFNTEEEGRKAYEGMNRKSTRACNHNFTLVIYPSQHSGKAAASASNALYIRNIPVSVPQHQVEQFLASFGTLLYCAMREDHYGSPVWVVYAEYDCLDCSANALRKLHGKNCYFNGASAIMAKYADSEEAKRERRRRREEGKSAPAPAPRSACVFPPPRRPQDACHAALGSSGSSNSAAGCSRESTNCSIGPTPNSDAASSVSSAYKVLDAVFTASPPPPPPPQMLFAAAPPQLPPMYPMEFSYHPQPLAPPVIHPGHLSGCSTESMPPVVIVLENGQQLLLAPNAVNVRPSDFAASAGNTLFWPSMDGMYPPMSPSQLPPSYAAVPFP